MSEIKRLILSRDLTSLRKLLSENPSLANEGIPFDHRNQTTAHPLHRICDAVFHDVLTDEQAADVAGIFLEHGANVNGDVDVVKKDSPLIAAASLHADKVGLLYIEKGADINYQGLHGGTALHWAAWTGRDVLVDRLIKAGADIHLRSVKFNSTPLLWAVHGYKFGEGKNRYRQVECVKLLVAAGADKNTPNEEGKKPIDFLDAQDSALREILTN